MRFYHGVGFCSTLLPSKIEALPEGARMEARRQVRDVVPGLVGKEVMDGVLSSE